MDKKTAQKYIEMGEVPIEEYAALTNTEKMVRMCSDNLQEVYWAILLDATHFVFCNNVLQFFHKTTVGKVGIYDESNGRICSTKLTADYQNQIYEKNKEKPHA